MKEFISMALPALLGLISGVVGSLIAPWIHWGIEQKRLVFLARKKLLEDAREYLNTPSEKCLFRESPIYANIKQFLSQKTINMIENDALHVQLSGRGSGVNNYVGCVLDDLSIQEKKWKLL